MKALKIIGEKKVEIAEMSKPEVYSNGEKAKQVQKQIEELSIQIDELTEKWESLAV